MDVLEQLFLRDARAECAQERHNYELSNYIQYSPASFGRKTLFGNWCSPRVYRITLTRCLSRGDPTISVIGDEKQGWVWLFARRCPDMRVISTMQRELRHVAPGAGWSYCWQQRQRQRVVQVTGCGLGIGGGPAKKNERVNRFVNAEAKMRVHDNSHLAHACLYSKHVTRLCVWIHLKKVRKNCNLSCRTMFVCKHVYVRRNAWKCWIMWASFFRKCVHIYVCFDWCNGEDVYAYLVKVKACTMYVGTHLPLSATHTLHRRAWRCRRSRTWLGTNCPDSDSHMCDVSGGARGDNFWD